jgi:hypothetical protein
MSSLILGREFRLINQDDAVSLGIPIDGSHSNRS